MSLFDTQNRLLLGKKETTFGTPVALTTADANVRIRNLELSSLTVEYDDESAKIFDGTLTHEVAIAGVARGTIDGELKISQGEFYYNSTGVFQSANLPYDKYLNAGGLKVTTVNPTDADTNDGYWTFAPNNSELCSTMSVAILDITSCGSNPTAVQYQLGGAMANSLTIESESAGKPYIMKFSLNGKVVDVFEVEGVNIPEFDDANGISTIADKMLDTTIRITALNDDGTVIVPSALSTFTSAGAPLTVYDYQGVAQTVYDAGNRMKVYSVGGGTPVKVYDANGVEFTPRNGKVSNDFCSNQFSLDTAPTLTEIMCQKDSSGLLGYKITGRDERITLSPLLEKISDWDFWDALTSEKIYKVEILGRQLSITVPYAQIITAEGSDDNGLRRISHSIRPLKNRLGANKDAKQATYTIKITGKNIIK